MLWHLLAVAADALSPSNPWAQLGIASIVCALLSGIAWTFWAKWNTDKDKWEIERDRMTTDRNAERERLLHEKDDLYKQMIDREQYMNDRVVPTLADALRILGVVPTQLESALNQAQKASTASEGDRLIREMQELMKEIKSTNVKK